ncbi:MAG: SRPBCC domain-containing protein [Geminicoccaceae bacterium]
MDMTGEYRIPAPRQQVWEALNDPEDPEGGDPGLRAAQARRQREPRREVKAKVGPVSATFTDKVTLSETSPPESYKISGEGKERCCRLRQGWCRRGADEGRRGGNSCATAPRPMSAASWPRSARA